MIPEGWELRPFGEMATFKNGLNFTKTDTGQTIKIVGVSDFQDYFSLPMDRILQTIQVANKVSNEELLQDDDFLFVRSNGNKALVGRCMIVKTRGEKISFSGFTIRGRVKRKDVTPVFIAHQFRTEFIKNQMLEMNGGTNISNLSQEVLSNLNFLVPPLEEQVKIAEVLTAWDDALETLGKLIAAKLELKRGLMQALLTGKQRFQEFEAREWNFVQIGDIAKEVSVRNKEARDLVVLSCTKHRGLVESLEYFGKQVFSKDTSTYKVVPKNSFAYATNHIEEGSIGYQSKFETALISPMYTVFKSKSQQLSALSG